MSRSLRAGGYLEPTARAIEDVCWSCRLQLQRRGFHTIKASKSRQPTETISADEENFTNNKGSLVPSKEAATKSSSLPVQIPSSKDGSVNPRPPIPRQTEPPGHGIPDVNNGSIQPRAIQGATVRYFTSPLSRRSQYQKTYDPRIEQVRRQINERAVQDQNERQLKATLNHAIQLSKLNALQPKISSSPPGGAVHSATPSRLSPSNKGPSGYTPRNLARQYSTNAVGEKIEPLWSISELIDKVLGHYP